MTKPDPNYPAAAALAGASSRAVPITNAELEQLASNIVDELSASKDRCTMLARKWVKLTTKQLTAALWNELATMHARTQALLIQQQRDSVALAAEKQARERTQEWLDKFQSNVAASHMETMRARRDHIKLRRAVLAFAEGFIAGPTVPGVVDTFNDMIAVAQISITDLPTTPEEQPDDRSDQDEALSEVQQDAAAGQAAHVQHEREGSQG